MTVDLLAKVRGLREAPAAADVLAAVVGQLTPEQRQALAVALSGPQRAPQRPTTE